jgi:hypothetical protein
MSRPRWKMAAFLLKPMRAYQDVMSPVYSSQIPRGKEMISETVIPFDLVSMKLRFLVSHGKDMLGLMICRWVNK